MAKTDKIPDLRGLKYSPQTGMIYRTSHLGYAPCMLLHHKGYRVIPIKKVMYQQHRIAWLMVHGRWPEKFIDHKNGDRRANWISNLQEVDSRGNGQNLLCHRVKAHKVGTSCIRGKWSAQISLKPGTKFNLGRARSEDEAAARYKWAIDNLDRLKDLLEKGVPNREIRILIDEELGQQPIKRRRDSTPFDQAAYYRKKSAEQRQLSQQS